MSQNQIITYATLRVDYYKYISAWCGLPIVAVIASLLNVDVQLTSLQSELVTLSFIFLMMGGIGALWAWERFATFVWLATWHRVESKKYAETAELFDQQIPGETALTILKFFLAACVVAGYVLIVFFGTARIWGDPGPVVWIAHLWGSPWTR